jgi:hypothetical protein
MASLKPQDVLVALKLVAIGDEEWSFTRLAKSLGISLGASHNAVGHLMQAGLVYEKEEAAVVDRQLLFDYLLHGLPCQYYPIRGATVRGVPTGASAPPLISLFPPSASDVLMVWPLANGLSQGVGLEPIYKTVPKAAAEDASLYEILTLVDAVRVGRAEQRDRAIGRGDVRRKAVELLGDLIVGPKKKTGKTEKTGKAEKTGKPGKGDLTI